jgi:hypothetical protein
MPGFLSGDVILGMLGSKEAYVRFVESEIWDIEAGLARADRARHRP